MKIAAVLVVLFVVPSFARGQYFTPAPVDMTGRSPPGFFGTVQSAVDEHGEVFVWNEWSHRTLSYFYILCEKQCLDPLGFVPLRDQASSPDLRDAYIGLYDEGVLHAGPNEGTINTSSRITVLESPITFSARQSKAFSLGRVVQGSPEEIYELVVREEIFLGRKDVFYDGERTEEWPVRFTTFVPEPSAVALTAFSIGCAALLLRSKGGAFW